MVVQADMQDIATCNEGYLLHPEDWNEEVAVVLAQRDDIELSEQHWAVLDFMRKYYDEHKIAADARFVIKYLADDLGYGRDARSALYRLFPYGYMQQACKIAGMRRPRAWSTG